MLKPPVVPSRCLLLVGCVFLSAFAFAQPQRVELQQELDLRWQGVRVASLSFDLSIPVNVSADADGPANESSNERDGVIGEHTPGGSKIEMAGQTRGPLKWVKDYTATARFMLVDPGDGSLGGSAMLLEGIDGGFSEVREVIFLPGQLPRVTTFLDSSAPDPLMPRPDWLGNTENPLTLFEKILLSAVLRSDCNADFWGFDGKRRYRLISQSMETAVQPVNDASNALDENQWLSSPDQVSCLVTLQAAGLEAAPTPGQASRILNRGLLGAFWPFGGGDREIIIRLAFARNPLDLSTYRVSITEFRLKTTLGPVVGKMGH